MKYPETLAWIVYVGFCVLIFVAILTMPKEADKLQGPGLSRSLANSAFTSSLPSSLKENLPCH